MVDFKAPFSLSLLSLKHRSVILQKMNFKDHNVLHVAWKYYMQPLIKSQFWSTSAIYSMQLYSTLKSKGADEIYGHWCMAFLNENLILKYYCHCIFFFFASFNGNTDKSTEMLLYQTRMNGHAYFCEIYWLRYSFPYTLFSPTIQGHL